MPKFDPEHAVVPSTNFGDKNSAERFLECGKFRQCANLNLIFLHQRNPPVSVYLPVCREFRFERAGAAMMIPIPTPNTAISPVTYMMVGEWAKFISCPQKCKGYRNLRWAKIRNWFRPMKSKKDIPKRRGGVFSNDWVIGLGVTTIVALAAFIVALIVQKEVETAELALAASAISFLFAIVIVWFFAPKDTTPSRNERTKFPERGDYRHSTSETRTNPDGSTTFVATGSGQIDRRPQLWE